jgi:tetratricopeptide (TPR) repeat protein
MHTRRGLHASGLLLATLLTASPTGAVDLGALTSASYRGDYDTLREVAETLSPTAPAERYALAYIQYRLAGFHMGSGDADAAVDATQSARHHLESLLAQDPDDAEAMTLLSSVLGMQIGLGVESGFSAGRRSGELLAQAEALAPSNPRVQLAIGISRHNTPLVFGGGQKRAIAALDKAVAAYRSPEAGWGAPEAYVWRALSWRALGDEDRARADLARALEIEPSYAWASLLLTQSGEG